MTRDDGRRRWPGARAVGLAACCALLTACTEPRTPQMAMAGAGSAPPPAEAAVGPPGG